ncbi:YeeE/YedE family protein [Thalassotalea sp. 1_MG-2023]|uniref:YeeE/YedE family protein n=1 Tax=Thalassotalea sp. 1_MG-2023 TaxID=3062680 RepID=UPI0026E1DD5A|nr:YeeE/YedE family protein [Thalassotalea sp. 1_MG-2023]MDO6428757.1 YeeE/YedE family protein [Thalassotalea sp. 1_MG-2023]
MQTWTSTPFEPWLGLTGGILIGLAVVMLLLTTGRIAGISGICAGAITKPGFERYWRLAFVLGLVISSIFYSLFKGPLPVQTQVDSIWMIIAGFLVGFGTRLGSGCTSGHGVAGIARLSRRSMVATLVFIGSAVIITNIIRHT